MKEFEKRGVFCLVGAALAPFAFEQTWNIIKLSSPAGEAVQKISMSCVQMSVASALACVAASVGHGDGRHDTKYCSLDTV